MVLMVFVLIALRTNVLGIEHHYNNTINQVRQDVNGAPITHIMNGVCSLQNSESVLIGCHQMGFIDIAGQVEDIVQVSERNSIFMNSKKVWKSSIDNQKNV